MGAEKEQVQVDKFWGLDVEESCRQKEENQMMAEDQRSTAHERFLGTNALINKWEEDEFFVRKKQALQVGPKQ